LGLSKKTKKQATKSTALSESTQKQSQEVKPREAVFHPEFREDLRYWMQTEPKVALRVMDLVDDVMRDPFKGIGKPEHLKYLGPDIWSRRINQEDRMVYLVSHTKIDFTSARFHYD
jgi:toxin YoeB